MPNLVCPSVRPVWSNQSLACRGSPLASSAAGGILGAQTLVMSVPRVVVVLFFFIQEHTHTNVCVCSFSRQGFLQGCSERGQLLLGHLCLCSCWGWSEGRERHQVELDVSCTSRRLLSPVESGSAGLRARMMHACRAAVSSSRTVRRYEAVRTTSEPHADSVPQSFVPLH